MNDSPDMASSRRKAMCLKNSMFLDGSTRMVKSETFATTSLINKIKFGQAPSNNNDQHESTALIIEKRDIKSCDERNDFSYSMYEDYLSPNSSKNSLSNHSTSSLNESYNALENERRYSCPTPNKNYNSPNFHPARKIRFSTPKEGMGINKFNRGGFVSRSYRKDKAFRPRINPVFSDVRNIQNPQNLREEFSNEKNRLSSSHSCDYLDSDFAPMYKGFQLLGDSQLVRFSEQILKLRSLVTYLPNSSTRRIKYCVSGQKIGDLYERLAKKEFPLHKQVIVLIGSNDIIYSHETGLITALANYENLIRFLKTEVECIVLVTVPPVPKLQNSPYRWCLMDKINDYIRKQANGKNIFVVDFSPLLEKRKDSTLMSYYEPFYHDGKRVDEIHLNRKGFRLLQCLLDIEFFNRDEFKNFNTSFD